jgi:hypothetical protein
MSLLKSNEGGYSSLEPKVFQHSLEKNLLSGGVKTLKTLVTHLSQPKTINFNLPSSSRAVFNALT